MPRVDRIIVKAKVWKVNLLNIATCKCKITSKEEVSDNIKIQISTHLLYILEIENLKKLRITKAYQRMEPQQKIVFRRIFQRIGLSSILKIIR